MKYFMMAFRGLDSPEEQKIADIFGESGFKFWHRYSNVWLVVTSEDMTAFQLSTLVDQALGKLVGYITAEVEPSKISVALSGAMQPWFEQHLGKRFPSTESAKEKN